MNNKHKNQRGSAIIWILIAVGLFAALGYAFNSSTRTSTSIITDAEAGAYAKEIINLGNDYKSTIQRMKLSGVKETDISFGNTVFKTGAGANYNAPGHNANCTTDKCEVFSVNGGGLTPKKISENATTNFNEGSGASHFKVISVDGVGTSEPELVMQIQDVKPEVCIKINKILNISTANSVPSTDSFGQVSFDGSYPAQADPLGDVETLFSGKKSFCGESNNSGQYRFFQVLIAR